MKRGGSSVHWGTVESSSILALDVAARNSSPGEFFASGADSAQSPDKIISAATRQVCRQRPTDGVGEASRRAQSLRMATDLWADASRRYQGTGRAEDKAQADAHAARMRELEGGDA